MAVHCACVLLTAYVFTVLLWKISNAQESGPYRVILKQLKNCADKGTGEMWVRASASQASNGTVFHTGELNLPYGLNDDNFKAVGEAHKRSKEGAWQPIGLVNRMVLPKACSSLKQMSSEWFRIVTAAGQSADCPLPKGKMSFKMYAPEPTVKGMKEMKYADYRIKLDFVRRGKKIGSMCYYATVVPSTT